MRNRCRSREAEQRVRAKYGTVTQLSHCRIGFLDRSAACQVCFYASVVALPFGKAWPLPQRLPARVRKDGFWRARIVAHPHQPGLTAIICFGEELHGLVKIARSCIERAQFGNVEHFSVDLIEQRLGL